MDETLLVFLVADVVDADADAVRVAVGVTWVLVAAPAVLLDERLVVDAAADESVVCDDALDEIVVGVAVGSVFGTDVGIVTRAAGCVVTRSHPITKALTNPNKIQIRLIFCMRSIPESSFCLCLYPCSCHRHYRDVDSRSL